MRRRSLTLRGVVLLLACFIFAPVRVDAQGVQDFTVDRFAGRYELSNKDKQGYLTIVEEIDVTYSGQNRGILRAIPATYQEVTVKVAVESVKRDGMTEPFITYEENDNVVLRIGDPDVYITGQHSYEIRYNVSNVIQFFDDHDELYWDINGDQWLQAFTQVEARITSEARFSSTEPVCYTGTFGSRSSDCVVKMDSGWLDVQTTRTLEAGETLTTVISYEKGYFSPPGVYEKYQHFLFVAPIVLFQLAVVNAARKRWLKLGKDYSGYGTEVPYFGRPKGVSVMQAAYVLENKLTSRHVSAAIIDLAIRGYIGITEVKKRFRGVKHTIMLKHVLNSNLTADESLLLKELVGETVGDTVQLEDKKHKLAKTFQSLSELLDTTALKSGYYELSPRKSVIKLAKHIVLGIIGLVVGFLFAGYSQGLTVATGIVCMIGIAVFAALMTKRSRSGVMLQEHMRGLKLYLSRAEKDRIAAQDAVAAPLSKDSDQPERSVAFFEKLLPFAVAVGVEKTWASAFADLYTEAPDWYSGNWTTFSTASLVNSINSTTTATSQTFSTPSSSGSSGFSSGGGFSGGGGGGGGGGGW